ncbi:hypothetical protein, partial [Cupriavidus basilensis]|uniref:hypothetical protein n=1 Tax=Cupriavidus basilensis TaxID=68895 RepID=UPI0023E8A187
MARIHRTRPKSVRRMKRSFNPHLIATQVHQRDNAVAAVTVQSERALRPALARACHAGDFLIYHNLYAAIFIITI